MNKNIGGIILSSIISSALGAFITHRIECKKKETVYFDLSKKKNVSDNKKVNSEKGTKEDSANEKKSGRFPWGNNESDAINDIPSYTENGGDEKPVLEKKSHFPVKYRDLTSEEFLHDENGYDKETLTLYSDGLLIDETFHKVSAKDTIGVERLKKYTTYFKENNGNGSFYIRNNTIETDYEIVYDSRKAGDVIDFDLGDE